MNNIATTILDQMGGLNKLTAMTGAFNVVYDSNSVAFKFRNRKGHNYIRIQLDADDTYSVTLGRLVKWELRKQEDFSGIYCDQLVKLFESKTGLFLTV